MFSSSNEHDTAEFVASLFPAGHQGVYVDVGAGYPEWYSNSYPFRDKGWTVIAIEPQPIMCDEFRELGLDVLQFACSDEDRGEVDFEILDNTGGMAASSFKILDDHPREAITTIKVIARTLTSLLDEYRPDITHIDVLDVDVEYYELEVLRGVDFDRYRPEVLVIENLPATLPWCNPNREALYDFYKAAGYEIVNRAGHNEILRRVV